MADTRISTAENPIPCPVLSPTGISCSKTIHPGWTVDEGHAGGHFWVGPELTAIFAGGHYDATAAISGLPFGGHLPENCPGESCPYRWRLELTGRTTGSKPPDPFGGTPSGRACRQGCACAGGLGYCDNTP